MFVRNRLLVAGLTIFVCVTSSQALSTPQAPPVPSNSQELSLFEAIETNEGRAGSPSRPARQARATVSEPAFTLVGVSRIGSGRSAILRHSSGELIVQRAGDTTNTAITGYSDYSIVEISSSAVSIRYPSNIPCEEFNDRGVRCYGAGNIAELVLANGEPLTSMNPAIVAQSGGSEEVVESVNADPANPFEALRNAQNARGVEAQDGSTTSGQFTPRRINPEDVPEGKRVIATPFGDRLVDL